MRVSSTALPWIAFVLLLAPAGVRAQSPQRRASATPSAGVKPRDPAVLFERGERALKENSLGEAESDFRQVLAIDPHAGAAYANLGVVYMRRKQWPRALEALNRAKQLLPGVAGIRLNIGLAYYRQNEFLKAIPPFESVVREQPGAVQPRYLLGLCYFFADRWADTV